MTNKDEQRILHYFSLMAEAFMGINKSLGKLVELVAEDVKGEGYAIPAGQEEGSGDDATD